jgi:hypothetical protein
LAGTLLRLPFLPPSLVLFSPFLSLSEEIGLSTGNSMVLIILGPLSFLTSIWKISGFAGASGTLLTSSLTLFSTLGDGFSAGLNASCFFGCWSLKDGCFLA